MNRVGALGMALLLSAATAPAPADVADAAMRGDVEAVRALLQQGADVNMAQGDGMTALHWAAERGEAEIAEMLLYAGASVKATTRIGDYTPLHLAAKSGSASILGLMVKAGADVHAQTTNSGATPLHFAAASGSAEAVSVLLGAGADANVREGQWQQTPLMFAASLNRADAIRALLAGEADPNVISYVRTPLDAGATRASTTKMREALAAFTAEGQTPTPTQVQAAIAAGRAAARTANQEADAEVQQIADRDPDEPPIQAGSTTDPGGMSPLLHAARQGHIEAVSALLDGGADINLVSGTDQTSPLLIATINSQWDVAMLLIEQGADPNLASSLTGAAPLWSTINAQWQPRTRFPQPQEGWYQQAGYLDVMEALIKAGADPDVEVDRQPYYIQFSGCGNGNCGLTQLGGTTAFLRAAHSADDDALRLLSEYGADIEAGRVEPPPREDRGGRGGGGGGRGGGPPAAEEADEPPVPEVPVGPATAIHFAAGLGFGQGVGAGNANRFKPEGWMPSMRYLVEELGFDVNARDTDGFTPLHFAAARGDIEMIHYLIEKGADVKARSRPGGRSFANGYTVADMANGPQARITPMPAVVDLLVSLGSENSNLCQSC